MEKDNALKPDASISTAVTVIITLAVVTLLILCGGLVYWYFFADISLGWESIRPILIVCGICWTALVCLITLSFVGIQLWQISQLNKLSSKGVKHKSRKHNLKQQGLKTEISSVLRKRYNLFWRHKIRLLLVTGEQAAVAKLLPELNAYQWLEGNRTVLIYGGSLTEETDKEKFEALRKLRRGRPLDGIIRVLDASQNLTPQTSNNDLRGLEKIGEALRYQPPVWLWQLCDSNWSQDGRTEQAVGASFPLGANQEEVAQQLEQLLPKLTKQGTSQVAENISYDFLLRLGQKLKDGGIARWAKQLSPWLYSSQQRVPLRGLMFSLPQAAENTMADEAALLPLSRQHALTLPATWQGIVDDCTRVRGRRVGMAWEQMLTWGLMVVIGIWGAGMLLSFILNYSQISSVASKAHDLVEHPSVSDYQLTALHDLRNDAGRLQNHIQKGAPWYQRFGLDHNQQLLEAMLPWYGVANNRLIRDPANAALTQKLNALANSEPNSVRRAQLAKLGYDQLKAWLMMARPDKVDGTFYAQTLKTVQPMRMGISTGLWQSLSPDLWAFYISELPKQPQWKLTPDAQLVSQSRQVLLQQIGRRNAESTLYENMLKSVRRNFADVSLEDMTSGTDARRLFTTDQVVPGMFTRQAWEGGIQQAIEKAANSRRDEIDWVLSDSQKTVSADLSPEALKSRLTQRYFTDFAGSWLNFLNSLQWNPVQNIADVADQLTLMSDVRQSPMIALMNTLAWQGQTGQQTEGLSDSLIKSAKDLIGSEDKPAIDQTAVGPQGPLDDTFGPLLTLMGKNKASSVMSADSSLSLQTYLTRITRVRLRLQQVASASDPQEMMQTLAQTVFKGKNVDLTDTQQYGILFTDGSQGISFELQARPAAQVVETQLTIDGQQLHYFNQMADWQSFRWPGDTYKPGTMLTWTSTSAGARLFGDYSGTWGFIRWLDQGKRQQLDRSQWVMSFTAPDGRTLQWVLRSQLGSGPLALLALRNFSLPEQIFSVDAAAASQAFVSNQDASEMDGPTAGSGCAGVQRRYAVCG
jgi:type VI secretion system protein ImpL